MEQITSLVADRVVSFLGDSDDLRLAAYLGAYLRERDLIRRMKEYLIEEHGFDYDSSSMDQFEKFMGVEHELYEPKNDAYASDAYLHRYG